MTRINVNIRVKELCREHLLAEHREIKRTPNKVGNGKYSLIGQPKHLMNDYTPSLSDRNLLVDRINERIISMQEKHTKKGRVEQVARLDKYKLKL